MINTLNKGARSWFNYNVKLLQDTDIFQGKFRVFLYAGAKFKGSIFTHTLKAAVNDGERYKKNPESFVHFSEEV